MGKNVFVSYKYADNNVKQFRNGHDGTTARDYVNVIQKMLGKTKNYHYRGEKDNEDNSDLDPSTVETILANKMFQTSITIVLITANMREKGVREIEQWIPWEISYSLQNKSRSVGDSNTNAVMALVIPDRRGSYSHALSKDKNGNWTVKVNNLFNIITKNMFNAKDVDYYQKDKGEVYYNRDDSYIYMVRWDHFCGNMMYHLEKTLEHRRRWDEFIIRKKIDPNWVS